MNAQATAAALAERTSDAYSAERYGESGWRACTQALLKWNDERETEAILRSKWTRWAADHLGSRDGHVPGRRAAEQIKAWFKENHVKVHDLVVGTFGG